ncbi:hypothetical protein [Nostoc sp. 'Peltigera membranacea cyanobiont' N6]|uniref:hypothetical protein n=1 Tax=Nostoc sp. 'Peltigera membranacea cyanobiont' N6 TaxID=1261031 RepID=UPI000CF31C36|nr:hypothetical protein [Nostoc sp. 'Peltigera membranacea cyanobiont' N6]
MIFLYVDITGKSPDSNQYNVFMNEILLGIVIKQDNRWFAVKPGSNKSEAKTFMYKDDAAKHLAELAKVDL